MSYQITVERFHPATTPLPSFTGQFPVSLARQMMSRPTASSTVASALQARGWGDVLFWLPGVPEKTIDALAHAMPFVRNDMAADYLRNRTLMCWKADGVELQLDMWMLNHNFLDTELSRGFGVALFNDLNGRYASHHMSAEEVDATIGGLQGAMTSSGPNYKPWRAWDEALLMSKSGAVKAHDPNVISPTALDWYDNDD